MTLCECTIPAALRLKNNCRVERAHRLGPQSSEHTSPRPLIAKCLNYQDKANILQLFRKAGHLEIEDARLLGFADHLQEVSRKRKEFSLICAALHNKQIRFMLAY